MHNVLIHISDWSFCLTGKRWKKNLALSYYVVHDVFVLFTFEVEVFGLILSSQNKV